MGYTIKNIPTNWEIKPMPEVVKWGSGGTPKATVREYYENGDIPWLIIGDLNDSIVTSSATKITELGLQNSSAKIIEEGTLMVAMYGSIGKLGITSMRCCTNQAIAYAKELHGVTTKYMFYYMAMIKSELISKGKGGTQKNISQTVLNSLIVAYPPSINEQERIVAKIEELFSDLDNAVETLNATKTQLEVYRQAVLKEAFEGKLTAKWRERNNIDYSFNKVNIKALVKKEKNSLKAGPFGSSLKKEFYVSNGYKIYGQEQVIAGDECIGDYYVNEEKYQELITCKVSPRDVLISLVGTVGKVLILSRECKAGLINPRLIKISLDENIMIPEYFKYYFESDFIKTLYKSKVHGATMDVLNMSMIKELPFLLCSIKEQEQIIYEIESRMSEYYNIENTVNMVLQQTSAMRQSILKQAFEGRLL